MPAIKNLLMIGAFMSVNVASWISLISMESKARNDILPPSIIAFPCSTMRLKEETVFLDREPAQQAIDKMLKNHEILIRKCGFFDFIQEKKLSIGNEQWVLLYSIKKTDLPNVMRLILSVQPSELSSINNNKIEFDVLLKKNGGLIILKDNKDCSILLLNKEYNTYEYHVDGKKDHEPDILSGIQDFIQHMHDENFINMWMVACVCANNMRLLYS